MGEWPVEPFRARHAELLYWGVKDDNHAQALVNGGAECTWAVCEDRVAGSPAHWFACDAPLVGGAGGVGRDAAGKSRMLGPARPAGPGQLPRRMLRKTGLAAGVHRAHPARCRST
jgi:hypothetical protein